MRQEESEILLRDIWPKLCDLGIIELRINGYTEWSDNALDLFFGRKDYDEMCDFYNKESEKMFMEEFENFRVTDIKIKIVMFHHCIADVEGYYLDMLEEDLDEDD